VVPSMTRFRARLPRTVTVALGASVLLAAATGCGGDSDDSGAPTPSRTTASAPETSPTGDASTSEAITIRDFAYNEITVKPGTTVEVKNDDSAPHTATGKGFDTGTIGGGKSGSFTAPTKAGTYDLKCTLHPQMRGTLTVVG
jgi:plastocyanin